MFGTSYRFPKSLYYSFYARDIPGMMMMMKILSYIVYVWYFISFFLKVYIIAGYTRYDDDDYQLYSLCSIYIAFSKRSNYSFYEHDIPGMMMIHSHIVYVRYFIPPSLKGWANWPP